MKIVALLALAATVACAAPKKSSVGEDAAAAAPLPTCTVIDWVIVPSTVTQYTDIVNGKEVRKARAEAITPTTCEVKADTTAKKK